MNTVVIESLKEMLRVVLLAIIPVLIDMVSRGELNIQAVAIVAVLAALRFLDKLLHLYGKETGNEGLEAGLTRF